MEQTATETNLLRILSNQLADAVERVAPALVLVNGRQRQPASGIVFATDMVLTADHVIEREEDITIETHDKRKLPAQFVGRDPSSDLAVLRVTNLGLTPAAKATDAARVGQLILAVGRSSSEGPMASSGIVSAIGGPLRTGRGTMLERYIRTDATPYPGFSGGPLIDADGNVLGVLTTGLFNGVALAIPNAIAWNIGETLSQQGYVKRGYLGISSQIVQLPAFQRAGRTQEHGLLIVKVDDNSPAQRGGIMLGDILVGLDGHTITDSEDLQALLGSNRVGKVIPVDVIRGNTLTTLQVTVGQRS
ncbi:MAG TPA: trypsin-like peptidase domain-containing protein [Ktedonobacteraceae bacterium]|nr:trypsin-like peptidase domain-containing protein [Ktedonobacteraceae bacterium]